MITFIFMKSLKITWTPLDYRTLIKTQFQVTVAFYYRRARVKNWNLTNNLIEHILIFIIVLETKSQKSRIQKYLRQQLHIWYSIQVFINSDIVINIAQNIYFWFIRNVEVLLYIYQRPCICEFSTLLSALVKVNRQKLGYIVIWIGIHFLNWHHSHIMIFCTCSR